MSKYFIFSTVVLLFLLGSIVAMPRIASRKRPRVPRECTAEYCHSEGTCHINEMGYAVCHCFIQYYSGPTCNDISSSCINSPRSCVTYNTDECWDYFGNHECVCKRYYYGRRCQHYGFDIKYATYLGIYLRRQPFSGTPIPVYVSYLSRERTKRMEIDVSGYKYELAPDNVTQVEPDAYREILFKNQIFDKGTIKKNIIIPQRFYQKMEHYFLHNGGGFLVCTQHMLIVHREALYAPIDWAETGINIAAGYMGSAYNYTKDIGQGIVSSATGIVTGTVGGVASLGASAFNYGVSWLPQTLGDWAQWGAGTAVDYANASYQGVKDYTNATYQGVKETAVDVAYGVKPAMKDYYGSFQSGMAAGDSYLEAVPIVGGYLGGQGIMGSTGFYLDQGLDMAQGMWEDSYGYMQDILNKDANEAEWAHLLAEDAGEESIEISYTYTHKIYTIRISDKWFFQYNVISNSSVCSPDLRFYGGVCSIFSSLPTTLLSSKSYRLDMKTLNRCGRNSTITIPIFKYKQLLKDQITLPMQEMMQKGQSTTFIFKMSTFSDLFQGYRYQLYGEVSEIDELQQVGDVTPRAQGYGRDMCWLQYHTRLEPVVSVDCGTQITLNCADHPTVYSTVYFIDDPTHPVKDDMGGYLTYLWECYKTSYGWIFLHGCDYWFTSYEKDKYLNFWWTVEGNIKLTVCLQVDWLRYKLTQRYFCDFTAFHIISYYGWIDVWNLPVFFLSCLKNCGEGTEMSYTQVDRGEIIAMKVTCQERCDLTHRFMWHFNDVERDAYDDSIFFHENVEYRNRQQDSSKLWNYKMIKPYSFSVQEKVVVVHVIGRHEKEYAWAAFTITFWVAPPINTINNPENCQRPPTLKGIAYYDDFFLCVTNVHRNVTLTFMYYQQVSEFEQPLGIMLGYSQAPYFDGAMLASSTGLSKINIVVSNDVFGSEYTDEYFPIEVYPPDERGQGPLIHMQLLEDVFEGVGRKGISRTSCHLNTRLNQIMPFTQKMHFIIIEMAHMGLTRLVQDQVEVQERKQELILKALTVTLPVDAIQIATLLYELVYLNPLPLKYQICRSAAHMITTLAAPFKNLIENDLTYHLKPYRVLRIIRPVVEVVSAIIFPAQDIVIGIHDDPMTFYVSSMTKDGVHVSEDDEKLIPENYPIYEGDTVYQEDKIKNYANSTLQAMKVLDELTKALVPCLYPTAPDKSVFWPALEMLPQGKSNMYFYVKFDKATYFPLLNFRIGLQSLALVNFTRNFTKEVGNDTISLRVIVTDSMPFWWKNTSNVYLPTTTTVILENKQNVSLSADVVLRMALIDDSLSYKPAEARLYVPLNMADDSGITCHLAFVHATTPRHLVIMFKHNMHGTLKVVVRTGKCPTPSQFNIYGKTILVGQKLKNGSFNYIVDYVVPKRNRAVFVYVGIVAKGKDVVQYQIKFNAISCAAWKTKIVNGVKNYDWEDECKDTKLTEAGNFVQCVCRTMNSSVTFAGSNLPVLHRVYGWMAINIDYRLNPYQLLLILSIGFLFFMAVVYFLASILDSHDEKQRKALYLVDNRPFERYLYIIVVCTGSGSPHRSTAHIGIKVYGSNKNSKRHVLVGVHDTPVLKCRGVDFFGMTTDMNLGKIRAVELWSDHRGTSPSWFCEKIIVRDYKAMLEWVFMVRKWFSLIEGDEKIHRILYQTKKTTPSFCGRVFQPDDMFIHHVWFGMFSREHCHSFSRGIKVVMAYSIVNTALFIGLFFYGIPEIQEEAYYDEGHVHIDRIIVNGIYTLMMSILINYPIMYIFKNCQVDPNYNYYYYDFSGIDPTVPIPLYPLGYYQRYWAWACVAILAIVTQVFMFWVGPTFGIRKSVMLLGSFFVALLFDVVLFETVHVIIRSFIWRGIYRNKDTQRFCNQVININCDSDIGLANNQNKTLLLKRDMMLPMRGSVAKVLQLREKYFYLYSSLLKEFVLYLSFIVTLYLLMMSYRPSDAFYSSQIVRDIVVDTKFTATQRLHNISSVEELMNFINYTIILSLHWQVPCWLPSANLRLLGVGRIRQLRNRPDLDQCVVVQDMEKMIPNCFSELDPDKADTLDYNPYWFPYNDTFRFMPRIRTAFRHQQESLAEAYGFHTHNTYVPAGGYIANLGRTIRNSRNVLNFLRHYKWVDDYTRVLVVEFTAFNINTNLINAVQLVIERSITGDFITSDYVHTVVMHRRHFISGPVEYFLYGLMIALLGIIIVVEIGSFFSPRVIGDEGHALWFAIDVINLALAITCVCCFIERAIILYGIMDTIDTNRNNNIILFGRHAHVDLACRLIGSCLIMFTTARIWKLLRFNTRFRIVEYTIKFAFIPLVSLTIVLIVFCSMTALMCYLLFGQRFMIWWNFYGTPAHIDYYFTGQLAYILFYCLFTFLLKNLFIAVIMVSYRKSREVMSVDANRFSFNNYVQERVLGFDKSELIRWGLLEAEASLNRA